MGLETGDLISSLNEAWPTGLDNRSEGDDHFRLLKHVLKYVFSDTSTTFTITKGGTTFTFASDGKITINGVPMVGGATISDTAPSSPSNGQFWWDSSTGNTYLWVDDLTSQQWVQQNVLPATSLSVATAETRNRFVNPAMTLSQENGGTAGTVSGYFPVDQWQQGLVLSGGVVSIARVSSVTPNGSPFRIRATVTTADTSLAALDSYNFYQWFEALLVDDLLWGTAAAHQVVFRFGFKGPAGSYSVNIRNDDLTRSYVALFTISAGQANTDTEQVMVIPGDTTGTYPALTAGRCFLVGISLMAGTTYIAPAPGWNAGHFIAAPGQSNGLATVNNTFEFFDAGLYRDPLETGVPPQWEYPDYAQELARCQRYYIELYQRNTSSFYCQTAGTFHGAAYSLPVTMRTTPAASTSGTPSLTNCTLETTVAGADIIYTRVSTTGAGAYRAYAFYMIANARM